MQAGEGAGKARRLAPPAHSEGVRKLKFTGSRDFYIELRKRVDAYLKDAGRRQRDCPQMYLKTGLIVAAFATSYALLVFVAVAWWQALPLAVLLGLSAAAVGFNIMHDAGHRAYSRHAWVNKLMSAALEVIGGSSHVWHWKHGVFHHTYVNITGYDTDISLGALARLTPHQRRLPFHRWQHWYIWPLYGLMAIKWHFFDDFRDVIRGKMDGLEFPRPRGRGLVLFLGGKLVFLMLAFGLPLLFHPLWLVALFYGVAAVVLGLVLSFVFQLAHCVEEADFPLPDEPGQVHNAWGIHQVQATVDFARRSRLAAWLLGGLNFQIEHHLFSRICHVNYPAISKLVEDTCREFGVHYAAHASVFAGIRSHFRWLRRMGASPSPA